MYPSISLNEQFSCPCLSKFPRDEVRTPSMPIAQPSLYIAHAAHISCMRHVYLASPARNLLAACTFLHAAQTLSKPAMLCACSWLRCLSLHAFSLCPPRRLTPSHATVHMPTIIMPLPYVAGCNYSFNIIFMPSTRASPRPKASMTSSTCQVPSAFFIPMPPAHY